MHRWVDRQVGVGRLQPTKGETILLAALFLRGVQVSLIFCPCALLYCPILLLCPVDVWFFVDVVWIETEQERTDDLKSNIWTSFRRDLLCVVYVSSVCPVTLLFFFFVV